MQLALTSLGFDTRGTDGIFGPRSREMIAAWQKARNQPVTRFLNTAQQEALLKEAAPALSKHDEQKKAEKRPRHDLPPLRLQQSQAIARHRHQTGYGEGPSNAAAEMMKGLRLSS